ncbi:BASS family bile acid:Na+ symporter [Roseiarcus fermentans]|uniref:BASS family bile acid:Na+ symporter n=1 Tax=Roseiarcus fermentans TaxID=1473586 RepID=A0A366ENN6_9HYPH|nr:Na+-dependent transporter [Roseiarcus fermentans]RBP03085.1 BASS family bile acid:Na+ symporter [Roseiarcus fermentans]
MTAQSLILLALKASIVLAVFAIGLASRVDDTLFLLRRPGLLLRSILAINVVMPLVAAAMAWVFDLPEAVEVALVALAVSPVPPLLPKKQVKARGQPSYAIGLLVAAALVAIVFVPLAVELLGVVFQLPIHMNPWPIATLVFATVLAPLLAGVAVRRLAPDLAAGLSRPIGLVATVVLTLAFLAVLVTAWASIAALFGTGAFWAVAAFVGVGLAVGHGLGGPDPHDRTVLALAAATRHPGVAMAIVSANFPADRQVLPAFLLYIAFGAVLAIPYVMWRKRVT